MHILEFFFNYILSFIVLILVLVFIHEFGHFLFARLFGVKVESFSIGFGKELFGFYDKKGTRWKIAPIPLGGYVKMKGEMLETGEKLDDESDSFHNKNLLQKALIVFAGPLFNLLLPIIIFFIIPLFIGTPNVKPIVLEVVANTPAANHLKKGDEILFINGVKINTFNDLSSEIDKLPNKNATLQVINNNIKRVVNLKIGSREYNGKKVGFLGIKADTSKVFYKKQSFGNSINISWRLYKNVLFGTLDGFKMLFKGKVSADEIGGPVKIVQLSGNMMEDGFASWLFFLAALSINLAIINLIPIPALDGGHLFLYLIEFVTRRKVNPKIQNLLVTLGFIFLMGLIVLITFNDIWGLIK